MSRPTERRATAIRFRPEVHSELSALADERDLSLNWLVNRACERYLASLRDGATLTNEVSGRADGRRTEALPAGGGGFDSRTDHEPPGVLTKP